MKYEIQNTPQLRFPGFEGEWENYSLKKIIVDLNSGISVNSDDIPIQNDSEVGILKTSCVANGIFRESENKKVVENEVSRAKLNPTKNEIIISRMNTPQLVGESGYIDRDYPSLFIPDRLWQTIVNQELCVSRWLSYFLITEKVRDNLKSIATGTSGTMKNISKPNFLSINVSFPTLPEQQKIASFLSAVDEKIQQLSRKKELLEQYKKGVMQQFFSGKLRFKDENGEDYADWEEKKLGDLAKITTGKLDANAMVQDGEYRFYTCAKDYFRIDKFAFDTEALLISGNGANVGYIHYYKGKFNAYQRTYVLDRIKENIIYLKFYLDNFLYERIYTEKKEGNTPYIVMSTLSEMEILMPSLSEQQKIASFLSSIDAKIESTSRQINQMQSFKKGLLQQLFV